MARRERTTGLPQHRRRQRASSGWDVSGVHLGEGQVRWGILGAAGLFLLFVFGLFGWNYYDEHYRRPNSVIVRVDNEKVTLGYYADRLATFLVANQGSTTPVAEQALVAKLEEEALTVAIAKDKGIDLSNAAIDEAIATALGVPLGGDRSAFDRAYRNQIATLHMSTAHYRKLITARAADQKLRDLFQSEMGDKGEALTLRQVVLAQKDQADAVLARIASGEDIGDIAQAESIDIVTRQADGLNASIPPLLLPQAVREAVAGKSVGDLLGPVEVDGSFWVVHIEKRDVEFTFSDTQKAQMAQISLDDAIAQKRKTATITHSFDPEDATWAEEHLG